MRGIVIDVVGGVGGDAEFDICIYMEKSLSRYTNENGTRKKAKHFVSRGKRSQINHQ